MLSDVANLAPGDPKLVESIVGHLKSQGMFDQFRRDCLADVDTKPAYQNLRQRVEGYVSNFLGQQQWRPDLNKNQLRDSLRRHINECDMLEKGVDRVVEQVVNPRVYRVFFPQIEAVVFQLLGKEPPPNKTGLVSGPQLVPQYAAPKNVVSGQVNSAVLENQKNVIQQPQQSSSQVSSEVKSNECQSANQQNTVETQTDAPSVVAGFKAEKKVAEGMKDSTSVELVNVNDKISIELEAAVNENSNEGSTTPLLQEQQRPKPESPESQKGTIKDVKPDEVNEKKDKIKTESPKKPLENLKSKIDGTVKKSESKSDSKHKTHSTEKTKNVSSDAKSKTDVESRKSSVDGKPKLSDSSSKTGKPHNKLQDKPEKEKIRSLSGSSNSPKSQKGGEEKSKSGDKLKSGEKSKVEQGENLKGKNTDYKSKHLPSKKEDKPRHSSSESSSKLEKHKTTDSSKAERHKDENKAKPLEKSRSSESKPHEKTADAKSSDDAKLKYHKSKSEKPSSSGHSDKAKSTDLKSKTVTSDKHKSSDHQKKDKERSSSFSKSDKTVDSTKHHSGDRDKKAGDSSKPKIPDKELGKNSGDKHKDDRSKSSDKSKSSDHKSSSHDKSHKSSHDKSEKSKSEHRNKHSDSPRSKDSSSSSSRHSSSSSKHKTESSERKSDEVKSKPEGSESKKVKEEKKEQHKLYKNTDKPKIVKKENTDHKSSTDKGNDFGIHAPAKLSPSDDKVSSSCSSTTSISKPSSEILIQKSEKLLMTPIESTSKEPKERKNEGSLIKSRHSYIPELPQEEKVEIKETSDISSPEQIDADKSSKQESDSVFPEETSENPPERIETDEVKSVGGWSDVTVSSVHTSDLSDYDDHITLTDSDSECKPSPDKEARKAMKGKTPSPNKHDRRKDEKNRTPKKRGRIPKRNLEVTPELKSPETPASEIKSLEEKTPEIEKVSPKEEEGEPRRELRRQRKINPRYMSDEFASIFSKGKDWLQSLDDESFEKEKPKKEDEQEFKPSRGKRTLSTASSCNPSIHEIELIHSPRSDISEMESRSQRRRSGDTSMRPLSPKSDVSADSYHSHHQRPFTPESTGSGDTSRKRSCTRQPETPTSTNKTSTAKRGRRERQSDQHASQRYDDSDLYKPRPVITASTRRSRASTPPLIPDVSIASGKRYPESSPIDSSPMSRTTQKASSDTSDTPNLEKHSINEDCPEKPSVEEAEEKEEIFSETETKRGRPRKSESSSFDDSGKKRRSPSPLSSEPELTTRRTRTPSSESNPRRLRGMKSDVIPGAPRKRQSLKDDNKNEPSVTTRGRLRRDSTENTPKTRAHKRPNETPKQTPAKRRR